MCMYAYSWAFLKYSALTEFTGMAGITIADCRERGRFYRGPLENCRMEDSKKWILFVVSYDDARCNLLWSPMMMIDTISGGLD